MAATPRDSGESATGTVEAGATAVDDVEDVEDDDSDDSSGDSIASSRHSSASRVWVVVPAADEPGNDEVDDDFATPTANRLCTRGCGHPSAAAHARVDALYSTGATR